MEKARAAAPDEMCTGVPPAKSRPPSLYDHPFGFQVQEAIGSYTIVDQTKMKTMQGRIRARSTAAPIARAGLEVLVSISSASSSHVHHHQEKV
ncbi:hypothetical protein RRF57_008584 [Xylaria bambusicola]|uniref:Uncharacterized protein n=1 Tax=Xylaria bambusicola TaxID=326684 RepID=A0AAN7ZB58_9PEZI